MIDRDILAKECVDMIKSGAWIEAVAIHIAMRIIDDAIYEVFEKDEFKSVFDRIAKASG